MPNPHRRAAFFRRKFAKENAARRLVLPFCECPGCETCEGFTEGCKCQQPKSIREQLDNG